MRKSVTTAAELAAAVRNVPDFPQPGIQFKDITPVLRDARLFAGCVELLAGPHPAGSIDVVVGIDARGFIFASAVALNLQAGFVPIRKKGKLPFRTLAESYQLEYGASSVEIHVDALKPGDRVLLVDDLLATGGTALAAANLLRNSGAQIVEVSFFIELGFLSGRARLKDFPVRSLVVFDR